MDNENTTPEATDTDEQQLPDTETAETGADATESDSGPNTDETQQDSFSRDYVEKLRKESAGYRDRVKAAEARVDELSRQLFKAKVAASGKLADATDLEYNTDLLDDDDALAEAIESLTQAKPHLKARKPSGDVGQGNRGKAEEPFSLLKALKGL